MYNILSNSHVINFCFGLFTSDDCHEVISSHSVGLFRLCDGFIPNGLS